MADFKKINGNAEADNFNRRGLSDLYKSVKINAIKQNKLKDEKTRESVMKFLFSGPDSELENPLAD